MPLIAAAAISHCPITGVHVITQKGVHDISSGKRDSAFISSSLPQRPVLQQFPQFCFQTFQLQPDQEHPWFHNTRHSNKLARENYANVVFFFFLEKKINANLNPKPALDLLQ